MFPMCRLDVDFARRPPTSWLLVRRPTGGQRSVGGHSRSLAHISGTIFPLLRRWPSSGGGWRQNFFASATMLL